MDFNKENTLTPDEMLDTITRVKRLYEYTTKHRNHFWFLRARQNGKTLLLAKFIKEYSLIMAAYERAEKKAQREERLKAFIKRFINKAKLHKKPYKSYGLSAQYAFIDEHSLVRCARCGKPADIAHKKKPITPHNIDNPSITLSEDNYEPLCHKCHIKEHERSL